MSRRDVSDELVCLAVVEYKARYIRGERFYLHEILVEWTKYPEKVCYAAVKRASDRGYIEYGVSLRTGWLTEKGKALISGGE